MNTLNSNSPDSSPAVTFKAAHGSLAITRPATGVVLIVLKGHDVGEFGDRPFQELNKDLGVRLPFEIFVDARAVPAASIDVTGVWAQWMMANRDRIQRFNIFCRSRFIEVTAKFVRQFTEYGPRMRIYTEADTFEAALRAATAAG